LDGHSAAAALLQTLVNQTYENKTAGAIVRDLADKAGVDVATAQNGITFPAYVIDARRSVYHHLREIADLCGFDLFINAEGKLVFEKFEGGKTVHVFEYAKHIIELEARQTPPAASRVETFGESRAGRAGDESWAWLTKDFRGTKGTAGSGEPLRLIERSALRTRDAARTAATAAMTAIRRQTLAGRLLILGRPEVKLGDAIKLRGVPDDALNKNFQVRRVTHRITKSSGFTTTIGFRSI
jgi:phage protein D